jgi:hypothetical protein
MDPGPEDRDFADPGTQLDRTPDGVFTRYGLSPADDTRLREEFTAWPRPRLTRAGTAPPPGDQTG